MDLKELMGPRCPPKGLVSQHGVPCIRGAADWPTPSGTQDGTWESHLGPCSPDISPYQNRKGFCIGTIKGLVKKI